MPLNSHRSGLRWNETLLCADDAITHLLFARPKGVAELLLVVAKLGRELAPNGSQPFEVVCVRGRR